MKTWNSCRVCGGSLQPILSLGEQYVSTFLAPNEPDGLRAPLDLVLCGCCRLLQLRHTVPADSMYKNYWYRSGTNQTMRNALADIAIRAEQLIRPKETDCVLDIGCNDGTLLASYRTPGIYRIGFDPAENLASFSRKVAQKVTVGFFEAESFFRDADLQALRPRIVTSIAMFYDLENPTKFVSDVKQVMHPDGLWVMQMSYLPLMLQQNDFGNICHEHLEYYSLQALEFLLNLYDFRLADVELNDVNGGSLRAYIRSREADERCFGDDSYRREAQERIQSLRESELHLGLDKLAAYLEFARRVEKIKAEVADFIKNEVARKRKVYVYGASTKGNTMLQYFGLDRSLIGGAA
jgi:NDP-4-keto-2,6-dideoxyhexose 3-C-methyltransferase